MKIIRDINEVIKNDEDYPVVALGNFDGIHIGHQHILRKVKEISDEKKGKGIVFTFEPHPVKVLSHEPGHYLLNSFEEKMKLIGDTGIDKVICVDFDKKFSDLEPIQFVKEILYDKIGAKEIVIGEDYRFGKKRGGGVSELKEFGHDLGFIVHVISPVILEDTIVSSSIIRRFLHKGNVDLVSKMLGRTYSLEGEIIEGAKRGSLLGFPTANILPPNLLLPGDGVYAVHALIDENTLLLPFDKGGMGGFSGENKFEGISYIGTQPTLGKRERNVEIHLFEFKGQTLYKKRIKVFFIEKIRNEMIFSDKETLINQINEDILKAKDIIKHHRLL